jgi:2-desacetyl-2-hydroxyethyl bacteriochlorophyllide A dehydrogenase
MNAIVNTGPGRMELREVPLPEPGPGQVRIRTLSCGVCATDLQMIAGWKRTGFPAIPGHEWCGVVDAVAPGVPGALVGRRCVADNVQPDGGEVGFEHPGAYGEYFVTVSANVCTLPDRFPNEAGALIEPLAVSVRALRRLPGELQPATLVFGDGPMGLLLAGQLARAGVSDVCMVGGRRRRLELAQALGVSRTYDYHQARASLAEAVRGAFGREFPCVIEASGSPVAMAAALELSEAEGRVLVVGDYGDAAAAFPWNVMLHRQWTLVGSNASAGAWPEAVSLAVGGFPLGRLVTHRFPVARFEEAIETARSCRDAVKVAIVWAEE